MKTYDVTLALAVSVPDDTSDDDLEEEIAYQVERYADHAVMIYYTERTTNAPRFA